MKKTVLLMAVAVLIGGILGKIYMNHMEMESKLFKESIAKKSVKSYLKDSDSVKFQNMNGYCGEVNARDGFGDYVGYTRFIGLENSAIIGGGTIGEQNLLDDLWPLLCE